MFDGNGMDGLEDIDGVDPYQITDLRADGAAAAADANGVAGQMSGMGASVACDPALVRGCLPPNRFDYENCRCVKAAPEPTWVDRLTHGLTAVAGGVTAKAQADIATKAKQLRDMQAAGQISQEAYRQQQAMLAQHAQLLAAQAAQGPSFWDRNKGWIILLGIVAVGGGAWYYYKKKR